MVGIEIPQSNEIIYQLTSQQQVTFTKYYVNYTFNDFVLKKVTIHGPLKIFLSTIDV